MTVETTSVFAGPYTTDGVATAFPFNFKALSADEVRVEIGGLPVSSSLFSVQIAAQSGTVKFYAPPAAGAALYVIADPDFRQGISFSNQAAFLPDSHNEANDRSAVRDQVLADRVGRALTVPIGDSIGDLPTAIKRAGGFLAFDASGKAIPSSGTGADAGLRTDLANPSGASLVTYQQAGVGTEPVDTQTKSRDLVSASDFGVDPTGLTDTTAALTAALVNAMNLGRAIHLPGRYLVSELKFPGTPALVSRHLEITGEPTFIQAVPNKRVLMIQDSPLQQSAGHRFSCTVVPHVNSDKGDADNIACDLTGFSTSRIRVRLGVASAYTSAKGRFNTVVYARSNSPFNYGNHIDYIANAVPAPKYGVRFGNGGSGVAGNPNINTLRAWCVALDTVAGDVLIDVGDSTQTIIEGPTLLEGCPNALGIKAGNLSSIRDVWFELIGSDIEFTNTASTVPNNCSVERCYFSGGGHTVRIANDLAAPPMFEGCVNDQLVTYIDQGGSPIGRPAYTRGYAQPQSPVLTRMSGPTLTLTPDQNSTRLRVDHHGRTSFFLRYIVTPGAAGESVLTLTPPTGFAIETATFGVRDTTTGKGIAFGLGDNANCQNYGGYFDTANAHAVNINVTLRATA